MRFVSRKPTDTPTPVVTPTSVDTGAPFHDETPTCPPAAMLTPADPPL